MQQVRIFGEVITVDPNRCIRSLGQCITCYLEGKIPCQALVTAEGTIIQTIEVESEKEYRCKYCEETIIGWWDYIKHLKEKHPVIKEVIGKTGTRYRYRKQTGRPRGGEFKECLLCGQQIYVRRHRVNDGASHVFCKKCANKLFLPPRRRKGQGRDKAGLVCQNCGSPFFADGRDLICLECGNTIHLRENAEELNLCPVKPKREEQQTETEVPEKAQRVGHYSKVKELKPIIVASVEKGLGLRQASREYGLAINTVRAIVSEDNKASQAQKARRAREKEHHWLRFALKGLAIHSEIYTTQEMIDHAIELLIKYMKGNPQRTICELIPEARKGASFRAEVLVEKTLEIMNEECLNYCSDIFEKVEDGVYKLKGSN